MAVARGVALAVVLAAAAAILAASPVAAQGGGGGGGSGSCMTEIISLASCLGLHVRELVGAEAVVLHGAVERGDVQTGVPMRRARRRRLLARRHHQQHPRPRAPRRLQRQDPSGEPVQHCRRPDAISGDAGDTGGTGGAKRDSGGNRRVEGDSDDGDHHHRAECFRRERRQGGVHGDRRRFSGVCTDPCLINFCMG
ncbi:hypothetical protein OsJ_23282 [Oryza sativa Japonica Group]|uniref:Uncharacterized protein n=1 Tax=Oryza sativa subsp. japonica TaxID=39947 RepID=A3BH26_ORYSJ|nr:hypothetical protein OsJ_23282 [Oryza sativa Japonica Group]